MTWVETPEGRLRVGKILCLVRNYRAHAKESGGEAPSHPIFFLKPATSLIHDGQEVLLPSEVTNLRAEAELAVVMGTTAKGLRAEEAFEHVLGYSVFLDMTARDLQRRASGEGMPWSLAKGMDTFGPVSAVRPFGEVPNPHALEISLKVNGRIAQRSSTGEMVHQIPSLLAAITKRLTLEKGDLVATGTPAGVPRVTAGDLLEAEISEVGRLSVRIRSAD